MDLMKIICETSLKIEIYDNNNEMIAKSETKFKDLLISNVYIYIYSVLFCFYFYKIESTQSNNTQLYRK